MVTIHHQRFIDLHIVKLITASIIIVFLLLIVTILRLTKDRLPGLEQCGCGSLPARAEGHRGATGQPPLLLLQSIREKN